MGTDPFNTWTIFLTQMIGLSVATERVTETIKQWLGTALTSRLGKARYSGAIQTIAIVSGVFVTALSGLNPLNMPQFRAFEWGNRADWLVWAVTGLLVSGGSAVWNHLLDILQATKVQKEQAVSSATPVGASSTVVP